MNIECSFHIDIYGEILPEFFIDKDTSVVIVKELTLLYIDDEGQITLPNVSVLPEDEFFQLSTAWDYPICIELLQYLQKNVRHIIRDNMHQKGTFELSIEINSEQ